MFEVSAMRRPEIGGRRAESGPLASDLRPLTSDLKFCQLMKGELTVASKYGNGSVFTVTLPSAPEPAKMPANTPNKVMTSKS